MEKELLIYLLRRKKNDMLLYKLLYYEEQLILAFVLSHILRLLALVTIGDTLPTKFSADHEFV